MKSGSVVTSEFLREQGVITNAQLAKGSKGRIRQIKVLGNVELTKKLTVHANKFSKSAQEKIQAVGGNVEVI